MEQKIQQKPGYSLASITNKSAKTVTAFISIDLHEASSALSQATEAMYTEALLAGAGSLNRAAFLNAISIFGATVSVGSNNGIATIFVRSTSAVFPKVMSIVETMLGEPRFEAPELKRIKVRITHALKEQKEESDIRALEALRNTIYGPHDRRYSYSEDALIGQLNGITKKHLLALHRTLHALPWTCSIVGSGSDVVRLEKGISKLQQKKKEAALERGTHQQKTPQPSIVLKNIPSRQNIDFSIGAPLPITLHHPDYIPFSFALRVLGGAGFASRLMATVRELEGLTYGIYSRPETFIMDEQGYWRIGTFFSPAQALQGLISTFREVRTLYENGITSDEFSRFREMITTADILKNDSTAAQLGELHAFHQQGFTLKDIKAYKERWLAVTIEEINDAIKLYLNPAWLTISGAGPISTVKKSLEDFMKTVT